MVFQKLLCYLTSEQMMRILRHIFALKEHFVHHHNGDDYKRMALNISWSLVLSISNKLKTRQLSFEILT